MPNFFLKQSTKIYFGLGEITKLGASLKSYKKVLIVIGSKSVKITGILKKITELLDTKEIKYILFEGIEPNPKDTNIDKATILARENKVEAIVALGGGSVMDASKLIAVTAKQGGKAWEYIKPKKALKIKEALPIITVPTLSATGSETNFGAVITNNTTKEKYAVHSPIILPKIAIIDPELTVSVPKAYLIDGTIDIITHSLETYFSNNTSLCIADNLSLAISKTAKDSLEQILKNQNYKNQEQKETNLKARESLAWSASLAINGILNIQRGGWPIHIVEHSISAIYDISHGAGLSFLLVPFMEFNLETNQDKISKFLGSFLHGNINHYKNLQEAKNGINDFYNWQKQIGAGNSSKISPKQMDIKIITDKVLTDNTSSLYNSKTIDENAIITILKRMQELWQ